MHLLNILKEIDYSCLNGNLDLNIQDIVYDSRKVSPNSVFVCLNGCNCDGHDFIESAVRNGAVAIVVSKKVIIPGVTVVLVNNTRKTLAYMARNFFENPAQKIKTIAITGTKGKTTVSFMIKSILQQEGFKVGIIGTIGILINDELIKTKNTTPESYEIQKYLKIMVDKGCEYVVIEASSLGLKHHRLDCIEFDYGAFTNFSEDHISENEHKDLSEYLMCKGLLFKKCKTGIINMDDKSYKNLLKGHTCKIVTYGLNQCADFWAYNQSIICKKNALGISFNVKGKCNLFVEVGIPGKFTVYNALCAMAVCFEIGISRESIIRGLKLSQVKGRVEIVPTDLNFTIIIDYAHNADSMKNVLSTLKEYKPRKLIVLFGAGGNRPKSRRYEMGKIAGQFADLCVVTEDNSRNESVYNIINDIEVGLQLSSAQYIVVPNRKEAIKFCLSTAQSGDIVVLAGKGHETYMEEGNRKFHFDEREIINDFLKPIAKI